MSFKYNSRLCFERYTSKNGAWKLEDLLEDKNVLSVVKKYNLKKTKKEICAKLEELVDKEKKRRKKKPVIEEESEEESEEEIREDPKVKNKLVQKCTIYSECPRGYTRKNLVDLAIECGVSVKEGKKSANMKQICANMNEKYGFKDDPEKEELPIKKKLPPKKSPKKKKRDCKNTETIISMTEVDEIPDEKYIRLLNGYCYDIDELVESMIMSRDRNVNPSDPTNLTPIWTDLKEKESIISHKGLDKTLKKRYKTMIDLEEKDEEKILSEMVKDKSETLNKIAEAGFYCLNDHIASWVVDDPALFQKAQKILLELRDTIRKSKLKLFYEKMRVGMVELGTTLDNAHTECIHGVGIKLLIIYCTYYYRISRLKSLKLSPFVYPMGDKGFIVAGMETEKDGSVKNMYIKSIWVDNSTAKNIGKYIRSGKDYIIYNDTDSTPVWIQYLKDTKNTLVRFFSPLVSVQSKDPPKKVIIPEKEKESPPPPPRLSKKKKKMSKKIVEIVFETDSESEVEEKKPDKSKREKERDLETKEKNLVTKEKNETFKSIPESYIRSVLKRVHPYTDITNEGVEKVRSLLDPMIKNFDLGEYPPKDAMVDLVLDSVREIPGELGKNAKSEVIKVLSKIGDRKEESRTNYIRHIVIEYLLAEVLELSGNIAWKKKKRITAEYIDKAIGTDAELSALFSGKLESEENSVHYTLVLSPFLVGDDGEKREVPSDKLSLLYRKLYVPLVKSYIDDGISVTGSIVNNKFVFVIKGDENIIRELNEIQSIDESLIIPDIDSSLYPHIILDGEKYTMKTKLKERIDEKKESPKDQKTIDYEAIKDLNDQIESEKDEVTKFQLIAKLKNYINSIDFEEYIDLRYDILLSQSKEINNMKERDLMDKEKNKTFKSIPESYIKGVLHQVHPDTDISNDGIEKVRSLLDPMIKNFDLGEYPPKDVMIDLVLDNIGEIPGELGKHAKSELVKVLTKIGDRKEESRSNYIRHVVIEYLLAEVLELSGNEARSQKKKRITDKHIILSVAKDNELNALFSDDRIDEKDEEKPEDEESSEIKVCDFYDSIDNKYKVFSNYAPTPITIDGEEWPTSEHYYHAMKFAPTDEGDEDEISWYREKIRLASTANKSKMLGNQKVTGRFGSETFLSPKDKTLLSDIIKESKERGISMRKNWEIIKSRVMESIIKDKIYQHPDIKKTLLSTGQCVIREASPTDFYWGIGKDNTGKNVLGNIWMKLRDELRGVKGKPDSYYKEMTESARDIPITGSTKEKVGVKKKSDSVTAYSFLKSLDAEKFKNDPYYEELKKLAVPYILEDDFSKYKVDELKYLIKVMDSKFKITGKKKQELIDHLKDLDLGKFSGLEKDEDDED